MPVASIKATAMTWLAAILVSALATLTLAQEPGRMDVCTQAAGPRPLDGRFTPGTTVGATVDSEVNGGVCQGVTLDSPGIWWFIQGNGGVIRASTCNPDTEIKVRISVFTSNVGCSDLRCVAAGALPDYECNQFSPDPVTGNWGTKSTRLDFPTFVGQEYFVLVQGIDDKPENQGVVWMSFRIPEIPQNNDCVDAIGPVPRDGNTAVEASLDDATLDNPAPGFCGTNQGLYPGVWFQLIGTGKRVTVEACAEFNVNGFEMSVYNGRRCDGDANSVGGISCVSGEYDNRSDPNKCSFGVGNSVLGRMTTFTFDTVDRDRYYVLINYAATDRLVVTSPFRLWVDDGDNGEAGSAGVTLIDFEGDGGPVEDDSKNFTPGNGDPDREGQNSGNGGSDNGSGNDSNPRNSNSSAETLGSNARGRVAAVVVTLALLSVTGAL